jgi:hypothetical protein
MEYKVYLEYRYGSTKWGQPTYTEIRDHPDGTNRYKRFAAWMAAEELLNLEWQIKKLRKDYDFDCYIDKDGHQWGGM